MEKWIARDLNDQLWEFDSEPKLVINYWTTDNSEHNHIITNEPDYYKSVTFENSPRRIV